MRFKNKIGWLGVVPCLMLGLVGFFYAQNAGPGYVADGSRPLAALAVFISSQFTPPPSPVRAGSDRQSLAFELYQAGELLTVALFAIAFWLRTDPERRHSGGRDNVLLALQALLALGGQLTLSYFVLLEAAVMLPLRTALKWLVAISLGGLLVRIACVVFGDVFSPYDDPATQLAKGIAMATMQAMALAVGALIAAESRGRVTLAAAHARLLATQQLLGDTVRAAERLRIARDLHDATGHHLTALILHLDLACRHQAVPDQSLGIARTLAQDLLAEVRTVVGIELQQQPIDLKQALQTLCAGIPAPHIVLAMDEATAIDSPAVAQALFHAIQEAITNTVRHAQASRLEIAIGSSGAALVASIADDGVGKRAAVDGNGLRGIRERVAALGGTLAESIPPGGGFCLQITLPRQARP